MILLLWKHFNPIKPNRSNYYTLSYRPNLPFLISDIRALWGSALSARVPTVRMSEIKNGRLGLYGAEYSKCNHMMTLGFKRLSKFKVRYFDATSCRQSSCYRTRSAWSHFSVTYCMPNYSSFTSKSSMLLELGLPSFNSCIILYSVLTVIFCVVIIACE